MHDTIPKSDAVNSREQARKISRTSNNNIPMTSRTDAEHERIIKSRRRLFWTILLIMAAAFGYWWLERPRVGSGASEAKPAQMEAQKGSQAIPIVPVTVLEKDVPIYLDGLGTVQALNTVTIHVRVDGQLNNIHFKEGQDVHEGDLLATVDPAPFQAQLAQTQAKKKQDEAQLANARLDLARDTDLIARKVISGQQFDTQKALVAQLEATVSADDAAIQSAQVQLGYTTVYSPIDGRIGIRLVDKGNIVHASDPNGLIVITQLHPLSVIFTLPEQNLDEIRKQMSKGELTVYALGRDNGAPIAEGKLTVIDNQIDTTTGTIKLKATFPNDDLRLWPGQFVNTRLLLTTHKNGIVVPAAVIQRGPDGSYAFVVKPDLTVEVRPVKVAQIQQAEALIEEGLHAGERVVLEGQYRLQANSHVKIAQGPRGEKSAKAGDNGSAKPGKAAP